MAKEYEETRNGSGSSTKSECEDDSGSVYSFDSIDYSSGYSIERIVGENSRDDGESNIGSQHSFQTGGESAKSRKYSSKETEDNIQECNERPSLEVISPATNEAEMPPKSNNVSSYTSS